MSRKPFFLFLFFLLGCDFASKVLASLHLPKLSSFVYPFGGIPIFKTPFITCSLNFASNTGAAWGMLAGYSMPLFALRICIIASLVVYLLRFKKRQMFQNALWLIITGAIGNAADYLFYGHVVDFIHFTFGKNSFPIFNLADSYITLGTICLLFCKEQKKSEVL